MDTEGGRTGRHSGRNVLPKAKNTLVPNVLGIRGGHVHVQVADVGLLRVDLQTLCDPEGFGAPQERVGDKREA